MRRYLVVVLLVLSLTACNSQSLQPAEGTAQAVIEQVAPTARAVVNQVAPTVRALVPTPAATAVPNAEYPSTLDRQIIACFAPRCNAEEAFILAAGTHYKDAQQDDGAWRFIQVEGGGQVWVLAAQLTNG
jgi:hypothetical protein